MADREHTDGSDQKPAGEYVVVARRYRPQTFDELIGQHHVSKGLAAAIASSRVGHAYLFTGARGTGKTSTARILAKALNCERGPTPNPCNQCDICRSITAGNDMDVLEIDGASNRGIDEIRQLRQNVNVRPSRARFKIYIIDEVHMLTEQAFNALLKTLEEPPEHVKFIFCTTEADKIPITILSRCQRYDFAGIQTPQIVQRLRQIAEAEGVSAEPEALEILARRAAGSMRDSQSLLEQLLAFGAQQITVADVHGLLGTAGGQRIARLADQLIARNPAAALSELDQAVAEGVDVGQLLDQLLGYFRDVMAAAVGCPPEALLHVSTSEQPAVRDAAQRLDLETLLAVLQILDQTISRLRYLTYPRILAELALVRICTLEDLDALPHLIAELRQLGSTPSKSASSPPAPLPKGEGRVPVAPPRAAPKKNDDAEVAGDNRLQPEPVASNGHSPAPAVSKMTDQVSSPLALWHSAADQLGGLAADMARQASDVALAAPGQLVVRFPRKYNSCKLFCERAETATRLTAALAELAGEPMRLLFEVIDEPVPQEAQAVRATTRQQRMYQACQQPFVRQAMELFNATAERLEEPQSV